MSNADDKRRKRKGGGAERQDRMARPDVQRPIVRERVAEKDAPPAEEREQQQPPDLEGMGPLPRIGHEKAGADATATKHEAGAIDWKRTPVVERSPIACPICGSVRRPTPHNTDGHGVRKVFCASCRDPFRVKE